MDEVNIHSKLAKKILSSFVNKTIEKKFGDGITLQIEELNICEYDTVTDTKAYGVYLRVGGTVTKEALERLWEKRSGSGTN